MDCYILHYLIYVHTYYANINILWYSDRYLNTDWQFGRLTYWLLFVMSNCDFVTFPCGILGQVWYLIVLIPDLCHLYYF